MTGVNQQVSSRKCSGFKVQGYNSPEVIDLPVVFSRPDIPIDRSHIPKSDSFENFSYLKDITSQLSYFPHIEIGLLIGYNCAKASVPLKVVLGSNNSQPYAVQTPLGWTIVGSASHPNDHSIVQDTSLNSTSTLHRHNINQKTSVQATKCVSLITRFNSCSTTTNTVRQLQKRLTASSSSYDPKFCSPHRKFDPCSSINVLRRPRFFPAKKPNVRYKIDSQFLGAM